MMKLITQIYQVRAQPNLEYQSNVCNILQLVFVFDPLQHATETA